LVAPSPTDRQKRIRKIEHLLVIEYFCLVADIKRHVYICTFKNLTFKELKNGN